MKAVIFSRSEGNRLRPVTCSLPKSMLPLMGKPILEHTVRLLHRHGIDDITVAADYLTDEIKKHFSFMENDTAKPVYTHRRYLEEFFREDDTLFISDSIVTDMDFAKLLSCFDEKKQAIIVTKPDAAAYEYGSVNSTASGEVSSYVRCPDFTRSAGSAFMGIAVIPKGTRIYDAADLSILVEKLIDSRVPVSCHTPQAYIKDVSDFESYRKCIRDFMDKKISLPISCNEKAPCVWIDDDATIMQGCVIVPPVYIGSGSIIAKGARIEGYTQIGRNVNVDCMADIKRSVVMDNTSIGESCSIRGCIVGSHCRVGFQSAVYEGSVIGCGTTVGKHCTVRTGVHIWPDKHIEDESAVSENIIWGSYVSPSMFNSGSAQGIINCEITPEFASTLARSSVSLLGKKIGVSCDGGGIGCMIKNALTAGIQSAGGTPYDLGEQPLPITRSAVQFYCLDGGIALSTRLRDGEVYGSLDIVNSLGASIENEELEKLEKLVSSADAPREIPQKICDAEFMFEYKLYYLKQLINSTTQKKLNAKLLIHCPSVWATELLRSAANDLECDFTFTQTCDKKEFAKEVAGGSYDMGAICDYKCEGLTLVTGSGQVVSEFDYYALTSLIIMKSHANASVFVPDCAPESVEELAKKYGATIHRVGMSQPHLMNELSKNTRKMFLHQFIYRFDAVGAIILLIDFLSSEKLTPEALLQEIPRSHMTSTEISCNSEEQANIIRKLCTVHNIDLDEPRDAIKVAFDNGWVLIVPKRTESVINVISHGFSQEYAQEIADIVTDDIAKE